MMQTLAQLKSGQLKGSSYLKISEQLIDFPSAIFDLADTLEYLDLSLNKLSSLPEDFKCLTRLKVLFASENLFTALPAVLGKCSSLRIIGFKSNQIAVIPPDALPLNLKWLILTNNKLKALPSNIGKCRDLQKLMLAGNNLSSLPNDLHQCLDLALLRISANQITELPNWLLSMPNLAWLAFAGNPVQHRYPFNKAPEIDPDQIELRELLGEGASGSIYRAEKKHENGYQDVAVKIFKGEVTSDGYPEDEMSANIASGAHSALIRLIGKVNITSQGKQGLVMELIPDHFFNLGGPPSLETCFRDIFDSKIKLPLAILIQIATNIASVETHLHGRGIIHGDLYAHNILINLQGESLLGDFGASSFYDRENTVQAFLIERIEVKAFGYLLDDLLSISEQGYHGLYDDIRALSSKCISSNPYIRPDFMQILEELKYVKINNT